MGGVKGLLCYLVLISLISCAPSNKAKPYTLVWDYPREGSPVNKFMVEKSYDLIEWTEYRVVKNNKLIIQPDVGKVFYIRVRGIDEIHRIGDASEPSDSIQ